MPYQTLAAALLAALLPFSAFAQGTTSTPCPPETGKAKARKIFGSIIADPNLRQKVAGQPCTPAPPAPASTTPAPAGQATTSYPQPKPGTNRLVRYNGQQTAIATGFDDKGEPVTYLQIPGQFLAKQVRQTGPDSYVMLTTPPVTFSVVNGEVTLDTTAATPPKAEPVASGPATAGDFGKGEQGMLPFNGGGGVSWSVREGTTNLDVWMVSRETGGRQAMMGYLGHDARGNHYLQSNGDVTRPYFRLTVINGVASIQGIDAKDKDKIPDNLNPIPNGSTVVARNDNALAGDGPAAGTISDNPLQLLDPTDAILTLPNGKRVTVTRLDENSAVWKDQKGNRYSVHNDRVVPLPK